MTYSEAKEKVKALLEEFHTDFQFRHPSFTREGRNSRVYFTVIVPDERDETLNVKLWDRFLCAGRTREYQGIEPVKMLPGFDEGRDSTRMIFIVSAICEPEKQN